MDSSERPLAPSCDIVFSEAFPPEIIAHVLSFVDRPALCASSLVCTAWEPLARRHLFGTLQINDYEAEIEPDEDDELPAQIAFNLVDPATLPVHPAFEHVDQDSTGRVNAFVEHITRTKPPFLQHIRHLIIRGVPNKLGHPESDAESGLVPARGCTCTRLSFSAYVDLLDAFPPSTLRTLKLERIHIVADTDPLAPLARRFELKHLYLIEVASEVEQTYLFGIFSNLDSSTWSVKQIQTASTGQ